MLVIKSAEVSRQHLLETCFSEIPQKVGNIALRKLSPGSFTLLGRLGSPMMAAGGEKVTMDDMFNAVVLYLWVHSADLETVIAIETGEDLPQTEIRKLGFEVDFGNALGFLEIYKRCSARMAAALAEVEDEEDEEEEPGKPGGLAQNPVGSPHLFTPSEAAPIPSKSDTSSGSCPSSEPSPISTPPMPPAALEAGGFMMPDLKPVDTNPPN